MTYETYKAKWHETKPIRGRSPDTRPIGKRRRDWEQVVRMVDANGVESYGAKLHTTVCVEYFKDGSIILRNGGWVTPSTARFIWAYSPFSCFKANNQLWVRVWDNDDERNKSMLYPVSEELRLVRSGKTYLPDRPLKINTRRIDREKAKAARAFLNPFLDYARSFLKLSDGWVMHETRKEALGFGEVKPTGWANCTIGYLKPQEFSRYVHLPYAGKDIYEGFKSAVMNETKFLEVLCMLVEDEYAKKNTRVAESISYGANGYVKAFCDIQTNFATIKRMLHKFVDNNEDVHKVVEVDPKDKAVSNVVTI
jgi:hypothetical protein